MNHTAVVFALLAAFLFGASTPLAKLLVGSVSPVMLGGLLYLGSGIGLGIYRLIRDKTWQACALHKHVTITHKHPHFPDIHHQHSHL